MPLEKVTRERWWWDWEPWGGCSKTLPFFRRGVGGQGDWFSVGGRESASQVSVTRIRPIEMTCESELVEPVVKNEGGVQWYVCVGVLWATEQSRKPPYRGVAPVPRLRRWAPQRAVLLKFVGLPTCIERVKLAHLCIFFPKERKTECVRSEFCVPTGQYSVETSSSL